MQVKDNMIIFEPSIKELGNLKIDIEMVAKHFNPGDNVRVVKGVYEGETGILISVKDKIAQVFSDFTNKEIEVLSNDLKLSSETTSIIPNQKPTSV